MVKDLLSQAEIDALLANVQAQTPRAEASTSSSVDARSFDLASRRRLKKRRLPGLEHINKRFSEYFRDSISEVLGQSLDVAWYFVWWICFSAATVLRVMLTAGILVR